MAKTIAMEMDSLKEEAVRVYTGMIDVFPQFAQEEALNVSELASEFNGCYATNNSTICFISDDEVFAIPYTRVAIRTLHSAGFVQRDFYVPFSNGDYPKAEQVKWNSLRNKARKSYSEDFLEDCTYYCDEHHIGTISEATLESCFEMPATGVRVKHFGFEGEDCYYPVINSSTFDCTAIASVGHYCTNNGKVVFVYRNGKTYVAKGYEILDELCTAGYTKSDMFVPFSNGEQILDPTLKARWEAITD